MITGKSGAFGGSIDGSCLSGKANGSVVLTHNHPLSSSFSSDDIELLLKAPEIGTIVAGAHDGTVYKLSLGKGRRSVDGNLVSEYNILKDQFDGDIDKVVSNLARVYGWRYERFEPREALA